MEAGREAAKLVGQAWACGGRGKGGSQLGTKQGNHQRLWCGLTEVEEGGKEGRVGGREEGGREGGREEVCR